MTRVQLAAIAFDSGTQIRAAINESVVAEYAERMTEGVEFPPIVLFNDGNQHYLADGFHRFMAARRNEFRDIAADVHAGTKTDALWFALGANKANGQRLTVADKKHAILLALRAFPDRSQTQIAEQVGCTLPYVTRVRAEVSGSIDLSEKVTGKDGKQYPASRPTSAVVEERRDERREAIAALVKEGRSSEYIVEQMKVRPSLVAEVRRELGVGRDNSREAVESRVKTIRDMAERGFTSRQIASAVGLSDQRIADIAKREGVDVPADRVVGKIKRHDSNRIVAQIVADAENLTEGADLIDFNDLNRAEFAGWLASLQESRDKLGVFIRRLMKEQQKHGEAA